MTTAPPATVIVNVAGSGLFANPAATVGAAMTRNRCTGRRPVKLLRRSVAAAQMKC
jgi:hypothetical protein